MEIRVIALVQVRCTSPYKIDEMIINYLVDRLKVIQNTADNVSKSTSDSRREMII